MKYLFIFSLVFLFLGPLYSLSTFSSIGEIKKKSKELGIIKVRVSRINKNAQLVRFRVRDKNFKFISQNDQLEFWQESRSDRRCSGKVMGKSTEYLLLKVPNIDICLNRVNITVGGEMLLWGEQFEKGLSVAQEVNEILLKKRLAIQAKFENEKKELQKYPDKVEAINNRYEVLMARMQKEWQENLSALEGDRIETLKRYKDYEDNLADIDFKLEQYRIHEQQTIDDRWALDDKVYTKKRDDNIRGVSEFH